MPHKFKTREEWLSFVTQELRPAFAKAGVPVPKEVRFAIGFTSHGYRGKAIGECWDSKASGDKHAEIFIKPTEHKPERVAGILAHELVHASVGVKHGHKAPFKKACNALGFEGPMRSALPSEAMMTAIVRPVLKRAGKLPHSALSAMRGPTKKAGTRLLKAECPTCGYVVRVTKKWLEAGGAPFCGTKAHGRMVCEADDDEEGEE